MDKLEKIKQAEQFILKDILYGTIAGLKVIDLLESNCETLVREDETVDQLAKRILDSLENENGELLYEGAHKHINAPLPSNIFDVSEQDKIDYKEVFIKSLPYSGDIKANGKTINIADYFRSLPLNEEYMIKIDELEAPRKLEAEYRRIMLSEDRVPTFVDKEETFVAAFDQIRSEYPNIDDLLKNNPEFQKETMDALKNMDNNLKIVKEDRTYDVVDYIHILYDKYSVRLYNSVDSKPNLVEPINLVREKGDLEVTSNYIFLSDDERESLINNDFTYTPNDELRDLFIGLVHSDSETIKLYKNRINEFYGSNIENDSLKDKVVKDYIEINRNTEIINDNNDDLLLLIEKDLNDIENDLNSLKKEYSVPLLMDMNRVDELSFRLFSVREKSTEMNINIGNRIEEIKNQIDNFKRQIDETMENVNHKKKSIMDDLEDIIGYIRQNLRYIDSTDKITAKAGAEARIQDSINEYNAKLYDNKEVFKEVEFEDLKAEIDRISLYKNSMGRGM